MNAVLWEWRATWEEGFAIGDGRTEQFRGHRIRYRKPGTRRWRSFLFAKDDGSMPTETEVLRAIEVHAERRP